MTRGPVSAACVTAGASASQTIARAHRAILTFYPTLLPGRSAWQCTDENGLLYRGEMAERSGRVGERERTFRQPGALSCLRPRSLMRSMRYALAGTEQRSARSGRSLAWGPERYANGSKMDAPLRWNSTRARLETRSRR